VSPESAKNELSYYVVQTIARSLEHPVKIPNYFAAQQFKLSARDHSRLFAGYSRSSSYLPQLPQAARRRSSAVHQATLFLLSHLLHA
jgi:hypothetical protein